MRIVDANVLLYAVNEDLPHHDASRRWLDHALSGADRVGFAWVASLAFLRLATRPGLFARPLSVDEAAGVLNDWHDAPGAVVAQPTATQGSRLRELLSHVGTGGNLVNDAHLATLALEHRGSIVTYDTDFTRFRDLRSYRPDDLLPH